jgi:hypothetical protein
MINAIDIARELAVSLPFEALRYRGAMSRFACGLVGAGKVQITFLRCPASTSVLISIPSSRNLARTRDIYSTLWRMSCPIWMSEQGD